MSLTLKQYWDLHLEVAYVFNVEKKKGLNI